VVRAEIAAGRSDLSNPYELLKELTRGRRITGEDLRRFVKGLGLEPAATERLLALTPATYTGLAEALVEHLGDD
jgi:adenylosuccinate lyase